MANTDLSALSADVLRKMMDDLATRYEPQQSLLMSAGYRREISKMSASSFKTGADNPILAGGLASYHQIPFHVVDIPKEKVLDWSGCRSPARAKRRHAKGYPQRVKITERDVAYLVDPRVLQGFQLGWERMAVKLMMGQ